MTDTIFSLIFPLHGLNELKCNEITINELNELSSNPNFGKTTLLLGEDSIYRTSLLFQACLSATQLKRNVVYICTKQIQTLPLFVHNMPKPDAISLELIKFKYLETSDELIEYLASLRLEASSSLPCMLVIQNIHDYIDERLEDKIEKNQKISQISSHFAEAVYYINTRSYCIGLASHVQIQNEQVFVRHFEEIFYLKQIVKDRRFEISGGKSHGGLERLIEFKLEDRSLELTGIKMFENFLEEKNLNASFQ